MFSSLFLSEGWYFEWCGESQREHPAWLHPSVFILTAAFETLEYESKRRQPDKHADTGEGALLTRRALVWAKQMLKFHGH